MQVAPEPHLKKCHVESATAVQLALAMLPGIYPTTRLNPGFFKAASLFLCWGVAICVRGLFCDLGPSSELPGWGVSPWSRLWQAERLGCGMLATRRAKAVSFWVQLALGTEIGSPGVVPAESPHPLSVGLSSPHDICVPCGISKGDFTIKDLGEGRGV